MPERVLVVEDDAELRDLLVEVLADAGYTPVGFPTAETALRDLRTGPSADLVLTDLVLPGMRGQELLREVRSLCPEINVIAITAFGSIESAIALVKAGAYDYLTKPLGTDELRLVVDRALQDSKHRREVVRRLAAGAGAPPGFVGASGPMQQLFGLIARAAHSRHPVMITGESGTGKELVARAVHDASGRGALVPVNCGSLPEHLLESELFGHEKGAFTGADRSKVGLFESADGGTLFLDEIVELPLTLQPKLLRALDEGEVRRVGAVESRRVDVRVIAATNRDLEVEVKAERFRADLYWRLNVLELRVPPLRERVGDVPLVAEHLLRLSAERAAPSASVATPRISDEAMALLVAYPWPGNVRELRNALEQGALRCAGEEIRPEDLPSRIRETAGTTALLGGASRRGLSLKDLERLYILEVLRQVGGNKSRAAELLDLDRRTLYRKLDEYRQSDPTTPS